MDEPHRHMVSIMNQTQKCDSTYMKCENTQNYSAVIEVGMSYFWFEEASTWR